MECLGLYFAITLQAMKFRSVYAGKNGGGDVTVSKFSLATPSYYFSLVSKILYQDM